MRMHMETAVIEDQDWVARTQSSGMSRSDSSASIGSCSPSMVAEASRGRGSLPGLRTRMADQQSVLQDLRSKQQRLLGLLSTLVQLAILRNALCDWDAADGPRALCRAVFLQFDLDSDEVLDWDKGEVQACVREIFHLLDARMPEWSAAAWHQIYRHSEVHGNSLLGCEETASFARHCFEVALRSQDSTMLVCGVAGTSTAASSDRVLTSVAAMAAQRALERPPEEFAEVCFRCFLLANRSWDERLTFKDGSTMDFVRKVFVHFKVPIPSWPESRWLELSSWAIGDCADSLGAEEAEMFAKRCLAEVVLSESTESDVQP